MADRPTTVVAVSMVIGHHNDVKTGPAIVPLNDRLSPGPYLDGHNVKSNTTVVISSSDTLITRIPITVLGRYLRAH